MSDLADLAIQGFEFRRQNQPATVKLAGQCYEANRTGFRSSQILQAGGFVAVRKMSFEIRAADFAAAGQLAPLPDAPLDWIEGQMTLRVDEVAPDPTGSIFVLHCLAPPQ